MMHGQTNIKLFRSVLTGGSDIMAMDKHG